MAHIEKVTTTPLDGGILRTRCGAAGTYLLGTTDAELEHLARQADELAPEARWLLDALGVGRGWRVVDMGCGALGILHLLAERVGTTGEVIGVDREQRMLCAARGHTSELRVLLIRADARASGLAHERFDLVHARALLVNVTDPGAVVREMSALCRSGGAVALQEPDLDAWICDPPHPAWGRLLDLFRDVYRAHGNDTAIGRRLPALLAGAGLTGVGGRAHSRLTRTGDYYHAFLLTLIELTRDRVVIRGSIDEGRLDELLGALRAHLAQPAVVTSGVPVWQVWGWKR